MNYHVVLDEEDGLFILLVLLKGLFPLIRVTFRRHISRKPFWYVKVIPIRSVKTDVPHSLMGK